MIAHNVPMGSAAEGRQPAEYVAMAEDVASAQRVFLFHEFNTVIGRLNKKYGVQEVAEQCRVWAEFIEAQVARIDGPEGG